MLRPAPPMSNAERQRRFQDAHPGYDRRRKSRRRSSAKRVLAQLRAAAQAMARAAGAVPAPVEMLVIPVPTTRLALPAPVELPVLPALNDIDALRAKLLERAA